ncbi:MAG TPA: DotU family type IV/VI secretion system protein [Polyangiaceae bacterium]|nr:DotU family type IV/VI secretion system protein [Polyangiaceae bacterium]
MRDEEQEELELAVWVALRRLEEAFRRLGSLAPQKPEPIELWTAYRRARADLKAPIVKLKAALEVALPDPRARPGESNADRALAALLIHYDERELASAQGGAAGASMLLQTEYCGLYDGGERFFVLLEDALRSPATPSLVLQLFLFCMRSGFCGRYPNVSDPERLANQEELCQRVGRRPEPLSPPRADAPIERIPGQEFPYLVYASALALLLSVWFGLHSLAKAHQAEQSSIKCSSH